MSVAPLRRWAGPAAVVAVGLGLRLAHLRAALVAPTLESPVLDPRLYDEWARAIAAGRLIGDGPFFQDPLYAYALGALYAVFGPDRGVAVTIQLIAGALVPLLVFLAARPWLEERAALAGGLLAALYPPAIFFEGLLLKTALATLLAAALLAALSRAARLDRSRDWAVAGILAGLGATARGHLLLALPIVAIWAWLEGGSTDSAAGRRGRRVAAFALGALAALAPAAAHNGLAGGSWLPTTINAGQNFYLGNNPYNETGEYPRLPFVRPDPRHEQGDFAAAAERSAGRRLAPAEVSRFWMRAAWRWIEADPGAWLRLVYRKLRVYWGAFEVPDNVDYYLYRRSAPVLRLPLPGFGVIAPLGLAGALVALRREGWPRIVAIFSLAYAAAVIAFFVFARFRMPMMPGFFVLAGLAIDGGLALAGGRRIAALAAVTLLAAFVNLPVRGPADSKAVRAAAALGLPVSVESSATARYNLGVEFAARARDEERAGGDPVSWLERAERELRAAWSEERRYASIPAELGKVLARLGRDAEAIEALAEAERLEPSNARYAHALGVVLRRAGRPAEAAEAFRRALRADPRSRESARELAEIEPGAVIGP